MVLCHMECEELVDLRKAEIHKKGVRDGKSVAVASSWVEVIAAFYSCFRECLAFLQVQRLQEVAFASGKGQKMSFRPGWDAGAK